ncbi:MAG: GH1 family beta-glucosidase [Gammaproteobacteria bacterium]
MPAVPGTGFPEGFLWGAATSAYQIEGSPLADGAGPSNWHVFAHTPGRIADGRTGDVACDHYRRWPEDLDLMQGLGLNAYRFSLSWSRILPDGDGTVNQAGLDFYRRLVDGLCERGIAPMATLFHWDLPDALERRGGWLNRDSAGWFARYAEVAFRALDDRVGLWVTLNEPWVVTDGGYVGGTLAPGRTDLEQAGFAAHHLLRAHAAAVQVYRACGRHRIGLVVNLEPKYPDSDADADRHAAARAHAYMNRQFLDPALLGRYPRTLEEIYGARWARACAAEADTLRTAPDFLGVNYYTRAVVRAAPGAAPDGAARVPQAGAPHTQMNWEVYPRGLYDALAWTARRYGPLPLYVTENGAAFEDPAPDAGVIDDPPRIDYLRAHLAAARTALADGVDLRGYFLWSLLDNFEWSYGYTKRFGIFAVEDGSGRRIPKASARWYAALVRARGAGLDTAPV